MEHQIKLINVKKSKCFMTKEYYGYNQKIKIFYDGANKIVDVYNDDPVYGISIDFVETGNPYLRFPSVPLEKVGRVMDSLAEAKAFCAEFAERKEEFLSF